jgi:septal ring-binding cell division protein DamX
MVSRMCSRRFALPLFLASLCMPLLAQPDSEPVRNPPVWPTPTEYLTNKGTAVQETAPPEAAEELPTPAQASASDSGAVEGNAYTVQLAAFRDLAMARRTARELAVSGAGVRSSQRDGESWYSVILGSFDTREAALAAEADYLEANPGQSTWVRSAAGLQPVP